MPYLQKSDKEIYNLIKKEEERLKDTLMMIPSENYASRAVEEAVGSVLGNKYSEGYPFKRYYQGQVNADQIESLAIERAKALFGVEHVNVQPYSGSPANFAVYNGVLKAGDTIMGLSLTFGGHLTHGADASVSSKYFKAVNYELNKEGYVDYKALMELAKKHKPQLIVAGTTAYPRLLDWKQFAAIAHAANAYLMADISHIAGLIAGKAYPSPVEYVDIITTTTHKTLRGPRGAMIMATKKGLKKDPDLAIKIDKSVFPGLQGGPHINAIAGIAVALKEDSTKKFQKYAHQVIINAQALAQSLMDNGITVVSKGTDSHLILADISSYGVLGNTAAEGLEYIGIVLNRNSIPWDKNPPFYPSGIRMGTPGITSRGMKEKDMKRLGSVIAQAVKALGLQKKKSGITDSEERKRSFRTRLIASTKELKILKIEILKLTKKFPIPTSY